MTEPAIIDLGPFRFVWHDAGPGWRHWRTGRFAFWKQGPLWEVTVGRLEIRWRVHNWQPRSRPRGEPVWFLADELSRPLRGRGRLLYEASIKALREHRSGPGIGTRCL